TVPEIQRRPDFVGTSLAFSPPTSAALRYWNMARQRYCRRLARNGKPCASLPTQSPSQPRTPARKAGVLDLRKRMRERDGLSAGGNRIRTVGSAGEVRDASCVRCPLCWHPLPLQKPKERTLVGPAEALPTGRHPGMAVRHHPGTPSEIKSECRARSSRIRKRLPPESAGMPFWRS